jgi:cytochrome P450
VNVLAAWERRVGIAREAFMSSTQTSESPIQSEAFFINADSIIAQLRAEDPVHWVPGYGLWWVTRHDDVRRLLDDPDYATGDRRAWEFYVAPPEGTFSRWVADHNLFSMSRAEHARVRRIVSAAFTPRAVARIEGQVRDVIGRYAAPLHGRRGVVDLFGEFTNPIPNVVISRITGVPPAGDDEARFRELAQTTIQGFLAFGDAELQRKGEAAFLELSAWVRAMVAERRRAPRDDLLSDLLQAQSAGDTPVTDDEIVILVAGLIGAGSETTALGGLVAIITLLQHPDAFARLRYDRALLPKALNEIVRFGFGGPGALPRYAVRDFELRGKQIRKGQMLMLSFGGANRDPAVYDDPDRLDLDRDPQDLLSFGHGTHFCLGAHLARQEMRCMLDAALDFMPPGSRLREDLMQFTPMGFMRRPVNLPVEFDV